MEKQIAYDETNVKEKMDRIFDGFQEIMTTPELTIAETIDKDFKQKTSMTCLGDYPGMELCRLTSVRYNNCKNNITKEDIAKAQIQRAFNERTPEYQKIWNDDIEKEIVSRETIPED